LFKADYLDWFKAQYSKELGLSDMGIKDTGIMGSRTLWIRYVRAGDGERCSQGARFSSGSLVRDQKNDPEIYMDLPETVMNNMVTRAEFISCMTASPLLSETLRRMGACDHVMQPRKPIALDVTILDPHKQEGDDLFQDAINVQQNILLEVWDSDMMTQDFLGEAWLPRLETLTAQKKNYVLPLQAADFAEDAERGPSRPSRKKNVFMASKDQQAITGELYVSLQWIYPFYQLDEAGNMVSRIEEQDGEGGDDDPKDLSSTEVRAEIQKGLHTGRLIITIKKSMG